MFALACGHHFSPDLSIATDLPFFFYWGLLFYGWTVLSFVGNLFARVHGRPFPMFSWRYLAVALLTAVPTLGFLPCLFLILPVWLYRAAWTLGAEDGSQTYRRVLRAVLFAGAVLVPVAYGRAFFEYAAVWRLGSAYQPSGVGALVTLLAAVGFFSLGYWAGRCTRLARASVLPRLQPTPRLRKRRVTLQPQQGCPLCWEQFEEGAADLQVCTGCETVSHRGCFGELGGCPTIGCRGRRERSRATTRELDGLYVRLRPGRPAVAVG